MSTANAFSFHRPSHRDPVDDPGSALERMLVCAPQGGGSPLVVLADGSYESAGERVFWREQPDDEVLRLPLTAPVSTRRLRHFSRPQDVGSAARLLKAVGSSRPGDGPAAAGSCALTGPLFEALRLGDGPAAVTAALALRAAAGLARVHEVLSACLDEVSREGIDGRSDPLMQHTATATARTVLETLQPPALPTKGMTVVLAPVPGDRHTLGLHAVAQQLRDAGHATLVLDGVSAEWLAELARHPSVVALVLSAHVAMPPAEARRLVTALRQGAPDVLIAAGGPGFPLSVHSNLDLVSDVVPDLVLALDARANPLTEREQEVLLFVAEGKTNTEIADELGIAPATVKTHLEHVFSKSGSVHRSAAVARALRQGWIR